MTAQRPTLASLLALCALAACSGEPGGTEPRFLSLGTAPPGGAFFVVGGALAEVATAHGPPGWQVTTEATKGSRENIRRLTAGEIELALSNAAITYFAVRGGEGWERAYPVQAVMTLAPNVALFVTPRKSGIRSMGDLRGKRVVVGPAGAGFEMFLSPILRAHGLGYGDLVPLNNTQAGAVDMLADRSAEAAFLGGAVPTASITQAATSLDLHFVPLDQREALIRDYPFFEAATIPAGTYRGQEEDFPGLNVGSMHLIAAAGADPELIYTFTRTIYENRERVVERHPAGRAIRPEIVTRHTGTDFHPGAIRYYREIGIWPDPPQAEAEPTP